MHRIFSCLALLLATGCASVEAERPSESPGAIFGPGGAVLSEAEMVAALEQARIVVLGEVHDNPVHHARQARLVGQLRPRGIAFEMVPDASEEGIQVFLAQGGAPGSIGPAIGWDRMGWPDWKFYAPIFEAARGAYIAGGGVARSGIRAAMEDGAAIARELYLSLLVDRETSRISFIVSTEGGMDIEAVAAETPEKILTFSVDPATGIQPHHGRKVAFALGLEGPAVRQCVQLVATLYKVFVGEDCSLVEINPLIVTEAGDLVCLDCKMTFDANALYRHQDLLELRDETEENPKELAASKHDLNYIALDGEIGCMVNGAGLAMATMDIIKLYGSAPATFLDVGGGATKEKVTEAFKIITSDPKVKGLLVNIFGGIMRCDVIAEGVVAAVKEVGLKVPLVVRLEGTNVELGKQIINDSGLNVIAADNLADAADKIVKAVRGGA